MNFTQKAHSILRESLQEGDVVVDGTMGNGFDTLFLSDAVGLSGKVFAFDIQELALQSTKARLDKYAKEPSNANLILKSHEFIYEELKKVNVEKISSAIFNLGYLPSSPDKSIATLPSSSLKSMQDCLALADENRFILSVLCYIAHENAYAEYEVIKAFFEENFTSYLSFRDENNAKSPILLVGDVKNLKKNV
ncbi:MAG: class I SAM-dependent methyltransferase [Opitutales bacterium]